MMRSNLRGFSPKCLPCRYGMTVESACRGYDTHTHKHKHTHTHTQEKTLMQKKKDKERDSDALCVFLS
jgi:hypothetical protein